MILTNQVKKYIQKSVLCWLATADREGIPNVSPKEIFTYFKSDRIIVANIASPQTVKNILTNNKVCISFIDILIQKGFQIKGPAEIIENNHPEFSEMESLLVEMTMGKFPFNTMTSIKVESCKPIIAPKYILFPETTEADQIASAKKTYGI